MTETTVTIPTDYVGAATVCSRSPPRTTARRGAARHPSATQPKALGDACRQFLDGGDPTAFRDHHAAVSDVLGVMAALRPPPHRLPVTVPDVVAYGHGEPAG